MEYLNRSKAAFRLSVQTFFEQVERGEHQAFLWTFTLKKVISVADAFKAWNKFAKALWKYGLHPETGEQTIVGIRVAEFHPGGHGVHFHVLINRRIPIQAVRRRAEQYGFGWIDVRRAHCGKGTLGGYLSKYLSKRDRPPCFKGRRLWQAFGQWGQTKCKDVVIKSEFVAAFHARRAMLKAAAAIAESRGEQYRMEGNLETMSHCEEHCWKVSIGKIPPLCPELHYSPPDDELAPMGWNDWDAKFDHLATGGHSLC